MSRVKGLRAILCINNCPRLRPVLFCSKICKQEYLSSKVVQVVRARVGKALIKHLQLANLFYIPNDIMVRLLTGQYFLVVVVVVFFTVCLFWAQIFLENKKQSWGNSWPSDLLGELCIVVVATSAHWRIFFLTSLQFVIIVSSEEEKRMMKDAVIIMTRRFTNREHIVQKVPSLESLLSAYFFQVFCTIAMPFWSSTGLCRLALWKSDTRCSEKYCLVVQDKQFFLLCN